MLWILVTFLIIVCILCYLLFSPFFIEINSLTGLYRIRFHRLASAQLTVTENTAIIDFMISGWHKRIDLLALVVTGGAAPPKKKKTKSENKQLKLPFHKVRSVINSFKVKECHVVIDTGDVQVNGMLFPVFYFLSKKYNKPVAINFINKNIVVLKFENNLARMISAFIFY